MLEKGFFNHEIEVIIGTNAEEGIFGMFDLIKDPTKWESFRNNFDTLGPMKLAEDNESEMTKLVDFTGYERPKHGPDCQN